jgi:hypothetical protein
VIRAFPDRGVPVAGVVEDTMVAAFLLDPTEKS